MAFDVEGYRKAAKDAGLSDEDIQKDIDEETQGIAAKGADADLANVKVGKDFLGIPEWLQPAAAMTAAGLVGAGATGLGMKLKDRKAATPDQPAPRVEPTFGIPEMEPQAQPQSKFTAPQGDVTDVASRPVGEPRLQIGGPRALPAPEAAVPTAATAPAPDAPVAPPATAAAAPVAPNKPVDPLVQARLDALAADQRRKDEAHAADQRRRDEAHANRLAKDAKRAEASTQQKQGQPKSNIPAKDSAILADNNEVKARAAVVASGQPKPPTASPVGGTSLPVGGVAGLPQGQPPVKAAPVASVAPPSTPISDKFVLPISSNPAETALTKEQMSARGWLANQYGGNNKYYEAVQDIFGGAPPSYNAAAGEKAIGKDAHQVVMDWRKSNIEGPKVNLTHDMKKVLKGGGGMAVLMALPGFAEAAQKKDMGKMSDIFTDFFVLPFAQSREAGMSKREEESIIAGKFKEASKLGSPYRSVPPPR